MTNTNANRRGRQFTPERLQQIRNLVERGKSREEIAELIGVTVGSLQGTCSRLGIGLTYTGSRGGDVPLPPINGQSRQNSQLGPVEQPQATPHEERARTDEMGLANLALRMKYRGERTRMIPMDRKSPVDTHIGQRLKEYRQLRGMTVRELADAAHVTPGQISHYEHGRDRISHERVTEFARILRIKSNDLYQPPGSRLRRNHVRWRIMNFMAAVIAEAAALMSSRREAAADNEATMVAAVAVAVAVSAAASHADAGERASLAISGNDTAVDTSVGSGSDSFTVNSDAALKLSPVSHSVAGTLTENETVEAINGKPAGTVSETRAFKIDAGATQQLDGSDAVNGLVITDGTNANAINVPGNHAIKAAWHASDDGRGGKTAHDSTVSATSEDTSARSTPADNHFTASSPLTETPSGNGDHSA